MATIADPAQEKREELMRLPRSTGALSGLLIVVLGVWGALIPFVGPYFHYAFGSYSSWHFTDNRLLLNVLPGVVAILGGLLLMKSTRRAGGLFSGWLAVAAGAWFVVGPTVSLLWHSAGNPIGAPTGGHTRQMLELIGYFHGLGVLIAVLAAFAMGRYVSRPRLIERPMVAAAGAAAEAEAAVNRPERGGFLSRRRRRKEAEHSGGEQGAVASGAGERDAAAQGRNEPSAGPEGQPERR